MRNNRLLLNTCIASVMALAFGRAAIADPTPTTVTVGGATLFQNFFKTSAASSSTNDFIDIDGNGFYGFHDTGTASVQQLAPLITSYSDGGNTANYQASSGLIVRTTELNLVYRSIGSVNGLQELINTGAQLSNPFASTPVSQVAGVWVNTNPQVVSGGVPVFPNSNTANGLPNAIVATGTDIAVMDVSSRWGLQANGTPAWNLRPTQAGYGTNPVLSIPSANGTWNNTLVSRTVTGGPGGSITFQNSGTGNNVLYDTPIAIAPINVIANPGVGADQFLATDLQHLYVTGRLPTGENLVAQTRSVGSGTRNGFANSLGVDPSFASGDNIGNEVVRPSAPANDPTKLGNIYQPTNYSGGGDLEQSVRDTRLGVGYVGTDTATADAVAQGYGSVKVAFNNVDSTNTNYVTPTIENLIHNNATGGWLMGGTETFVTIGDPNATTWSGNTGTYAISGNQTMSNPLAALYVRNINESIKSFVAHNATVSNDSFMPGQLLGDSFLLTAVPDRVQNATDGTFWQVNPNLNSTLQTYETTTNLSVLQAKFNSKLVSDAAIGAGRVPFRNTFAGGYSDGSTNGSYRFFNSTATSSASTPLFAGGVTTNELMNNRNKIAGDFNGDGSRNSSDVASMMTAIANPTQWAFDNRGTASGTTLATTGAAVPELLGDFNGDGNFNKEDIRYFADGLNTDPVTHKLDRKAGFTAVDSNSSSNYFGTTLKTGKPYANGDSRGDVFGSAAGPSPGAGPTGANGTVNASDIDYVIAQIKKATGQTSVLTTDGTGNATVNVNGAFSTILTRATANPLIDVRADLSADMTGDLMINKDDLTDLVQNILGTRFGDVNLDGKVDGGDLNLLLTNYNHTGSGWAQGNFLGTATVDGGDLNLLLSNYGFDAGFGGGGGGGFGPAGTTNVPEPVSLAILALGAGMVVVRRRRR